MGFRIVIYNYITLVSITCHDFFIGNPDSSAKWIKGNALEPAVWMRSDTLTVNCTGNDVISAIRIMDLVPEKLSQARVKSGGIGSKSVVLELHSSGYEELQFVVRMFAFPSSLRHRYKTF